MTKVTQAHIDARREAIRAAARRLFVRKGVEGARMEEIAAEAGLSAGAIYRYFPSKEHLLRSVIECYLEQNHALFELDAGETVSPFAALLAKGRMVWDLLLSEEGRQQTILGMESALAAARYAEGVGEERRAMGSRGIDFAAALVQQAQHAGELDPRLDARALATTLLASWIGMSVLALDFGDDLDTDASFALVAELLRRCAPEQTREKETDRWHDS